MDNPFLISITVAVRQLKSSATIQRILNQPAHVLTDQEKRDLLAEDIPLLSDILRRLPAIETKKVGAKNVFYQADENWYAWDGNEKTGGGHALKYDFYALALSGTKLGELSLDCGGSSKDEVEREFNAILQCVQWCKQ